MIAIPIDRAMNRSFIAALLMTGHVGRAEAAVDLGIRTMNPDGPLNETLLQATIKATMQQGYEPRRNVFVGLEANLPDELKSVFDLPQEPRRCFVLRVLIGLPRKICAGLLHLDVNTFDDYVCDATQALALPVPA